MSEVEEVQPNNLEESDSEEDFTAMPELCDKVELKPDILEAKKEMEKKDSPSSATKVDVDGWEDVLGSGRLKRRIATPGQGEEKPQRGNRVTVTLEERLKIQEGTFNSSSDVVQEQHTLEFSLGESEVIQCLDLAVPLMSKGEVDHLEVEHSFAYGDQGDGQRLKGGQDLCVTVALVDWKDLGSVPDIPLEERAKIGNLKRERGNKWYSRGDYSLAVQCYRKATEYLDDKQIEEDMEVPIDRFMLPKDIQQLLEDRVKTFNNMAQAQMKLGAWDSSLASLRQVLRIQPNNEKALFRKSKILQEKCQLDEAIGILRRINRLYPNNKQSLTELTRLTTKVKASKTAEQNMSRKMLGLDKDSNATKGTSYFSKKIQIMMAALGGLGALAGAYLVKQYNVQ